MQYLHTLRYLVNGSSQSCRQSDQGYYRATIVVIFANQAGALTLSIFKIFEKFFFLLVLHGKMVTWMFQFV